ncbi:MAG: hypothetical protein CV045_12170 [Cyanobacteria bacterium M5B4]|nr:MAG: hypothetical protein CV045_12170 [Cyanobacteria bacterium M5B4]
MVNYDHHNFDLLLVFWVVLAAGSYFTIIEAFTLTVKLWHEETTNLRTGEVHQFFSRSISAES